MHIIHGKKYNLDGFDHPGGNQILELSKNEPDCTALFESYHAFCDMGKIRIMMKKYEVGDTDVSMFSFEEDGFYNTCRNRVTAALSHRETKANMSWLYTVIFSSALFVVCQYFLLFYDSGLIKGMMSILSGITLVSLGYNVLHDGSHHSISKHHLVNKICSELMQALLLLNNTLWSYHHCIRHHQYTGNHNLDPDMKNSAPYFRKTDKMVARKQEYSRQYIGWKLAMFNIIFPGTTLGQAIAYHLVWRRKGRLWGMDIPTTFDSHDTMQYLISIVFVVVETYYGGMYFLLHIIGTNIGFFIGSAPDHDMYTTHLQIEKSTSETDWGETQVKHSANFLNNWPLFTKFCGGINYQIEHHLFPSLTNHQLEKISPIVRQCCKDFNIHYHAVNDPLKVWREIVNMYESVHK